MRYNAGIQYECWRIYIWNVWCAVLYHVKYYNNLDVGMCFYTERIISTLSYKTYFDLIVKQTRLLISFYEIKN